jgi:hypothetical protein
VSREVQSRAGICACRHHLQKKIATCTFHCYLFQSGQHPGRTHAACCASLSLLDRTSTLGRLTCVFDGLSMYEHSYTVSLLRRLWSHYQEIVVSLLERNVYTSVTGFSYGIKKYLPCRMKSNCYSDGTNCHAANGDASVSYQARFMRYPQITSQSTL